MANHPVFGKLRASNGLKEQGIIVSPGGVNSIWIRDELNNTKKRLTALEAKMTQEGFILTEAQLKPLERKKRS